MLGFCWVNACFAGRFELVLSSCSAGVLSLFYPGVKLVYLQFRFAVWGGIKHIVLLFDAFAVGQCHVSFVSNASTV